MSKTDYPRDLVGYGNQRPQFEWPGKARVAVSFVLNCEEGGENSVLHGDERAETFLSEMLPAPEIEGARHMCMESLYEYGSRAGVWRILRFFEEQQHPITVFAVGSALERNPALANLLGQSDHEIAGHGYKWIDHQRMCRETEARHIEKTVQIIEELTGKKPQGWYTGRSSPNTLRLAAESGLFAYLSDDYSDDIPFYTQLHGPKTLIIPYALDTNDMRFAAPHGFVTSDQFYTYLKDSFDTLYEEGDKYPSMMSVGLHCRLVGRPGRIAALKKFVAYVQEHDAWICRRIDIAEHWHRLFGRQA